MDLKNNKIVQKATLAFFGFSSLALAGGGGHHGAVQILKALASYNDGMG